MRWLLLLVPGQALSGRDGRAEPCGGSHCWFLGIVDFILKFNPHTSSCCYHVLVPLNLHAHEEQHLAAPS